LRGSMRTKTRIFEHVHQRGLASIVQPLQAGLVLVPEHQLTQLVSQGLTLLNSPNCCFKEGRSA
jgi:hypothetical protein